MNLNHTKKSQSQGPLTRAAFGQLTLTPLNHSLSPWAQFPVKFGTQRRCSKRSKSKFKRNSKQQNKSTKKSNSLWRRNCCSKNLLNWKTKWGTSKRSKHSKRMKINKKMKLSRAKLTLTWPRSPSRRGKWKQKSPSKSWYSRVLTQTPLSLLWLHPLLSWP